MKRYYNIVTAYHANKLLEAAEALPQDRHVATFKHNNTTSTLRYCTSRRQAALFGPGWVRTGGIVVTSEIPAGEWQSSRPIQRQRRLSGKFSHKRLKHAIMRNVHELALLQTLIDSRNQLFRLVETREIDESKVDAMIAERGLPGDYSKMSAEDCNIWYTWAMRQPLRKEEDNG